MLKIKSNSTRELTRIPVKIKLLTGTYILQPLRCRIYKEENSEICLSCGEEIEMLEHLVLECSAWDYIRNPALEEITTVPYTKTVHSDGMTCHQSSKCKLSWT